MNETWVAPVIAGVFALAGIFTTVVINSRAGKTVSESNRAPDVTEAWREADRARAHARRWEDLYYLVRGAFKSFARRVQAEYGDTVALSTKEREALEEPTPEEATK